MSKDRMGECQGRNTVTVGTQTDEQDQHLMRRNTVTVGTQTTESFLTRNDQLLPGIPDDITLHHISTKLPWRALYIMSLVSPSWLEAIRSRRIYDAKVRAHSTETLVVRVHSYDHGRHLRYLLTLYSIRDQRCYELPPIPGCDSGIPFASQCTSLDGIIYVLGRMTDLSNEDAKKEVYALDLVCPRQWKKCASMAKRRAYFACGVVDGKIYVFGGRCNSKPRGSEVYDPKVNVWSPIMPNMLACMKNWRSGHLVATLGQELLLYDWFYYSDDDSKWHPKLFSEVYNPVKDEWKVVDDFDENTCVDHVFVAQGKLHLMTETDIYVYDTDNTSWRYLYSSTYDATELIFYDVCVGNGELLASFRRSDSSACAGPWSLFQSIGFGSEKKEIRWQILPRCSGLYSSVVPLYCDARKVTIHL